MSTLHDRVLPIGALVWAAVSFTSPAGFSPVLVNPGLIEVRQGTAGREALGALYQPSLELAPDVALELVQALAVQSQYVVVLAFRPPPDLEPERAPDPLNVDADHPGALAAAPEGGDRYAELYLVFGDRENAGPGVLRLAQLLRERVAECPAECPVLTPPPAVAARRRARHRT